MDALVGPGAGGAFVCTRPWTGLVVSGTLVLAVWIPISLHKARPKAWLARQATALIAGGLPFALAVAAWNKALYGHALLLGYTVAFGPAHGLGFHTDPWGNEYGPVEALAYTGSDLTPGDTPAGRCGGWLRSAPGPPRAGSRGADSGLGDGRCRRERSLLASWNAHGPTLAL
jgi:hypothetical protein